jgi:hypothetical protein
MVLLLLTAIGGVPAVAAEKNQWTGPSGEGEALANTAEELALLRSATMFARDYNRTMFRVRHGDVLKICPRARPDNL